MAYDTELATMTVYMEASGESPLGMLAVAYVLVNRKNRTDTDTLATVCLKPFQFSCWNTSDPNRIRMAQLNDLDATLGDAEYAVTTAINGSATDPTDGAVNYYSTSMRTPPDWSKRMTFTAQIGKHRFYK
jgi:spore germination cell wall hydrolase CwlJ-like protein